MPDPLNSVTARISTRISALLHLSSTVSQYLSNIKDKTTHCSNTISEINTVYEVLCTLQAGIQNNTINKEDLFTTSQRLEESDSPLNLLETALQELTTKFGDSASTVDIKFLRWPFKWCEAEKLIRYISNAEDIYDNTLSICDNFENVNILKRSYMNDKTILDSQYQEDDSRSPPEMQSKRQRIDLQGNFINEGGLQLNASKFNSGGGPININTHTPENRCLIDLRTTDPQLDKIRIEETKGGLLANVYNWIFNNVDFRQWHQKRENCLLWIKGDPGKGKTMLLCGIINELHKSDESALAYFFCQATDTRINNAVAVLRGLIYMLLKKQPALRSHLQKRYEVAGEKLFKDVNTFIALSEILKDILQDKSLKPTILIVDALDECQNDLPQLLRLIVSSLSISSRIKWLVSSRNLPEIEEEIDQVKQGTTLSLELNAESVSAAIKWYVREKVDYLAKRKRQIEENRNSIECYLLDNANGTFLWVALVCRNLERARLFTISKLQDYPSELDPLYSRMIRQITHMEDIEAATLCLRILSVIVTVYRPITLDELSTLMGLDNEIPLEEMIKLCDSFLVVRNRSIFFVHQSAKDFLCIKADRESFPLERKKVHTELFQSSMIAMSKALKRNIYDLNYPGFPIDEVKIPDPDPLLCIRYPSLYWVDHLRDGDPEQNREYTQDNGNIHAFLRGHLLHWLEVMSLMGRISESINAISILESYGSANKGLGLYNFILDAKRFILYNRIGIEHAPLQIYCSALLFAPEKSIIRITFQKCIPSWISRISKMQSEWGATIQTLEYHLKKVNSVAFSPNGQVIASGSNDKTIRLWHTATGEQLQCLEGHRHWVSSVAFSPNGQIVVSGSRDKTIRLWNTKTGELLKSLEGHSHWVSSVAFSPNGQVLASGSSDKTIRLWNTATGELLQCLKGHSHWISSVAFSPNGQVIASGSSDKTIRLWNTATGELLQCLEGHWHWVSSVAFSPDGRMVASGSEDKTIRLWNTATGELLQKSESHSYKVSSVAFSPDGQVIVSGSGDNTIRLWNTVTGKLLQKFESHSYKVSSVAFSPDGRMVASGSEDTRIRLWNIASGELLQTVEDYSQWVSSVAFSPDGQLVAFYFSNGMLQLWNTATGEIEQKFEGHSQWVSSIAFSPNSQVLASGSNDKTIRLWNTATGELLQCLEGHWHWVSSVAFSPNGQVLASGSIDKTICLWNTATGELLWSLERHSDWINSVAFSPNGQIVASGSNDKTICLWNTATGELLWSLEGHSGWINSVIFSPNGQVLASGSSDKTIRLWNTATGELLQCLKGHSHWISSVAFSPDGGMVVSSSEDMTMRLWNIATSELLQTLKGGSGLAPHSDFEACSAFEQYSISNPWITERVDGQIRNVLWLPPDYRPFNTFLHKRTIIMSFSSGKFFFLKLEHENLLLSK